ncbi:MAG: hypothetical protein ACPGXX_15700, partial [Planctomycetaceae bacterium]
MESACLTCRHMREIVSGTGARYLLCRLSQQDSAYAKYPRQPLPECDGYQAAAANLQSGLSTDLLMPDAVADEEKRPGNKGRARAASMIE